MVGLMNMAVIANYDKPNMTTIPSALPPESGATKVTIIVAIAIPKPSRSDLYMRVLTGPSTASI